MAETLSLKRLNRALLARQMLLERVSRPVSAVVEQLFAMKGMGTLLVASILSKDLFVVQALSAIIVFTVVIVNLLVDLSYAVIDPRIRHMRALS